MKPGKIHKEYRIEIKFKGDKSAWFEAVARQYIRGLVKQFTGAGFEIVRFEERDIARGKSRSKTFIGTDNDKS